MKKNVGCIMKATILIMLVLAGAAISGQAQPVIENAIYYTDCWYDNPLGWQPGHHFVACAKINGSAPITAEAKDQNGTIVFLSHDRGNWYCRLVDGELMTGVLTINATDRNGAIAKKQSNNLDRIRKVQAAQNIRFSNESISPAISWDPIADIDRYYVSIYQLSNQEEVFRSPRLKRTGYQVPDYVMAFGTSYEFRILAHDYDVCSQHASGLCVENRSSTWSRDFTPRAVQ
ncbi:MAG: hypothetical protein PVI71_06515 [Desulfobacterales bacterium]|jgi:hypothetical protein